MTTHLFIKAAAVYKDAPSPVVPSVAEIIVGLIPLSLPLSLSAAWDEAQTQHARY